MAENELRDGISAALFDAVLNRMNITWEPDKKEKTNVLNAIEEAQSYLRKFAGNSDLSFEAGDLRTLLITCAWYIVENKRAEFEQEYSGDLIGLRLEEGFGCGKETESTV